MTEKCFETGKALKEGQGRFASPADRDRWNNRRKTRGAQLYDMFMLMRFERGYAKKVGLFNQMCSLASKWRAEDKKAKRASYAPPPEDE